MSCQVIGKTILNFRHLFRNYLRELEDQMTLKDTRQGIINDIKEPGIWNTVSVKF